jgi:hypothetical protein
LRKNIQGLERVEHDRDAVDEEGEGLGRRVETVVGEHGESARVEDDDADDEELEGVAVHEAREPLDAVRRQLDGRRAEDAGGDDAAVAPRRATGAVGAIVGAVGSGRGHGEALSGRVPLTLARRHPSR